MCEVCGDLLELLESHDVRIGDKGGMQLTKTEVLSIVAYVQLWPQRQCMCCYKDFKNFDRFNDLVQLVLHRAIGFIDSLSQNRRRANVIQISGNQSMSTARVEDDAEDVDVTGVDPTDIVLTLISEETGAGPSEIDNLPLPVAELYNDGLIASPPSGERRQSCSAAEPACDNDHDAEDWSTEEKDRLFQFVAKVFLTNFPLYISWKHCIHTSLEDLSKQDASALNNYCELSFNGSLTQPTVLSCCHVHYVLTVIAFLHVHIRQFCEKPPSVIIAWQDPEVPVFLLRNVCYFCDSNGIQALAGCFRDSDPEILPCSLAHTLITICANVRLWMNFMTASRYVAQIRRHIVQYMCRFAEKDLRLAATRNMTDLIWQTLKEPRSGISLVSGTGEVCILDRDGLELAFKYFTCSMLTLRLAGIAQINSQISLYNELAQSDSTSDVETAGYHLADWLIENSIVEQIFGPNLHIELKHCGKQVCELLLSLVKHLDITPAKHLLNLMSQIEPAAHTEQTLLLASAIIRLLWSTAQSRAIMSATRYHGEHVSQPLPQYYTMIGRRSSYSPDEADVELAGDRIKVGSFSSSVRSDSSGGGAPGDRAGGASSGNETEEGEVKARHLLLTGRGGLHQPRIPKVLVKLRQTQQQQRDQSCTLEEQNSSDEEEDEEDEEEEDGESNSSAFSGEEDASPVHVTRSSKPHAVHGVASNLKMRIISRQKRFMSRPGGSVVVPLTTRRRIVPRGDPFVLARQGFSAKTLRYAANIAQVRNQDISDEEDEEDAGEVSDQEEAITQHMKIVRNSKVSGNTCEGPETDEDDEDDEDGDEDEDEDSSAFMSSPDSTHSCSHQACEAGNIDELPAKNDRRRPGNSAASDDDSTPKCKRLKPELDQAHEKASDKTANMKLTNTRLKSTSASKRMGNQLVSSKMELYSKTVGPHEVLDQNADDLAILRELECQTNSDDENRDPAESGSVVVTEELLYAGGEEGRTKVAPPNDIDMCLGMETSHQHSSIHGDFIEDILSPEEEDEGVTGGGGERETASGSCCNSSHFSDNNKSEKNMSDFDGEGVLSDEELSMAAACHIGSGHPCSVSGLADNVATLPGTAASRQLANCATPYPLQAGVQRPAISAQALQSQLRASEAMRQFGVKLDEICLPGNTLLWDLVQDHNIEKLPEGLAPEAEKILLSLVCYSTNRTMRTKFIEACIENVANHRSVVISLRLMSKIFTSFNQYRPNPDSHQSHGITMWAERELSMCKHFFNDMAYYTTSVKSGPKQSTLYSHKEEIQARLYFLTCIFSNAGSPESFRLTMDQVDALWNFLAMDPQYSDECLNWFLNVSKSKDHHALDINTLRHIFIDKMPLLRPEDTSMIGLSLFNHLCHLARIANTSVENPLSDEQVSGIDQLWGIALRADNTDVSLTAIQYLNNYYINFGSGALEKEEEFVQKCMESLSAASSQIDQKSESSLLVIQRGLILLTNHLESFRKRYAFHLRQWQIDSHIMDSHQKSVHDKHSIPVHVVLQPAGSNEKTTIEMLSTDLVAELRAEVTRWWDTVCRPAQQRRADQEAAAAQIQRSDATSVVQPSVITPILGSMLVDGPMRMITVGQELSVDIDEKTLAEVGFKDGQLVFISQSANRPLRKQDGSIPASHLPAPPRSRLPMMLLSRDPYFACLFSLLQQLSNCNSRSTASMEQYSLQMKSRMLSRKVWDLLMLLPTNPEMNDRLSTLILHEDGCESISKLRWEQLLDSENPHKLVYSLQIVESLSRPANHHRRFFNVKPMSITTGIVSASTNAKVTDDVASQSTKSPTEELWNQKFIRCGGLRHLFNVFLSGRLQAKDGDHWNEWLQDSLAYLLKLMTQFSVMTSDVEVGGHDDIFDMRESPARKVRKHRMTHEKLVVPRLNQAIVSANLSTTDIDNTVTMLMNILYDAAMPRRDYHQWPTTSWSHVEVVHYTVLFLVSLAHSFRDVVHSSLCSNENLGRWLKRLTLESPEPPVRQEACQGLYKLCLSRTADGQTGYSYLLPILANLLPYLDEASVTKTPKKATHEDKEPFGPGCRDYFWLVCHLVEGISKEDAENSWQQEGSLVDVNELASQLAGLLVSHSYLERRHNTVEDDGLIGLLTLSTAVIRHNPPFKSSPSGQAFLSEVFNCLFALPSPKERYLSKCKSQASRSAAYDLLVELAKGNVENYSLLHSKVMMQHHKDSHQPYSWDTWPHDEERAKCGYVGLTNLGATCYMATCMQHLYMIPEARKSVIEAQCTADYRHEGTLLELKKMFTYLLESERKAYNPRNFCKVYTMDHQPLNTGEQKDMTEFFTDLISKLEEMGPELKRLVKHLFGGIITNNVVSLDCPHVSRTKEEFYTVRCQVTDMKNLYESLDEVTVKDMLEGDNMYTCSKCQRKVRAEKRACFKKLPMILCFNTMRYTFNMVTMMKEKVNTHFSFPLQLDMSPYMEKNLIRKERLQADDGNQSDDDGDDDDVDNDQGGDKSCEYELIGVTVHTGTADGGHYYSFIRDRLNKNELGQDHWYLFNDAEVKPFDPAQIAAECFGGEMTSKTYDSATDKFMDFSFEKTNSAYMLFYERIKAGEKGSTEGQQDTTSAESNIATNESVSADMDEDDRHKLKIELSAELADWIWQDNKQFLQDKNIFEHTYFSFMWQMCSYIPTTLPRSDPEQRVSIMAAKLSASFILETLIHAKEKPTMLQWIEIATKLFNTDSRCCEWFLDTMAEDDWWPQQILIRCPNQTVRQMFQRLVIHVINQLKPLHSKWYCHPVSDSDDEDVEVDAACIGNKSCVTRFVKKMFAIMQQDSRPQCKYLTEYFSLLLEFTRMGDSECLFLLHINAISQMITFFMSHKQQENYADVSDEEEKDIDDVVNLTDDKYSAQSLDKMITLIAVLVEKSRVDKHLRLSDKDFQAITGGGKTFPFLYHQIRDNINIRQTCNLVFSLCRWNDRLAVSIIQMVFQSILKSPNESQPFFKMLSLLVELTGGPPGLPPFMNYVLQKFWSLADGCPQQCLEWLSQQVVRNKAAHIWTLSTMDAWVETFLMNYSNIRVRNAAAYLLIALVPNNGFRQAFRSSRNILSPHKEHIVLSDDALDILHKVYGHLLKLLAHARKYVDPQIHGTSKLVPYFAILNYCLLSRTEKLMFQRHFTDLWLLFQPKLSEPPIAIHHNKQAMLLFWHQVCLDCPENVRLIVTNPQVTKNIAFNYILADHEEQEVILVNRTMLPAYYGILRMCCQQSQPFTRLLAQHQNMQWAFKNITTHPTQYTAAVDELFRIMTLMVTTHPETTEDEIKQINNFRRSTILLYLQILDARNHWQTLVTALKILVVTNEDRLLVIQHQGLPMLHEAFNVLHLMHHEATACHVTDDILALLILTQQILSAARKFIADKKVDMKQYFVNWKDRTEYARKLLTLLNSYTAPEIRSATFDTLREMILTFQNECIQTIVPLLKQAHSSFQEGTFVHGPYFPKLGQKLPIHKTNIRSPRPQFQMFLHSTLMEVAKGSDAAYDAALCEYYDPYHHLIDLLVRVAVNQQCLSESVVNLSATVACEGVPLHMPYFAKLWYEIYMSESVDRRYMEVLCASAPFIDYVATVLLEERTSLNNAHIHQFFCNFFNRVYQRVLHEHDGSVLMETIIHSITSGRHLLENALPTKDIDKIWFRINGDLRAMLLLCSVQPPKQLSPGVLDCLRYILLVSQQLQQSRRQQQQQAAALLLQQQQKQQQQEQYVKVRTDSTTSDTELVAAAGMETTASGDTAGVELTTIVNTNDQSCGQTPSTAGEGNQTLDICQLKDKPSTDTTACTVPTDSVAAKTIQGKGKTLLKRRCPSSKDNDENDDDDESEVASPAKRVTLGNDIKDTLVQLDNAEPVGTSSSRLSSSSSTSSDDDEEGDSSSKDGSMVTAATAASVLLIPKERPTTLDMVVKNVEALFRLLKK